MNTHALPPAEAEHIIDAERLAEEFNALCGTRQELHMSTGHLWYLAISAQATSNHPTCPAPCREVLRDFLKWAQASAGFGPEMLKLLRDRGPVVQTAGPKEGA
jgi:hypothetical protein